VAAAGARKIELTKLVLHVCGTESDAPKRFTAIDVDVELLATSGGSEVAGTDLDKLVTVAERGCLVSNTLRDALELTINRKSAQIAVSA
jgi:putative redox protein